MDEIDYRKRRQWMKQNNLEPDWDNLKNWLRSVLDGIKFEQTDILAEKWFRRVSAPGSDWTREAELERWITAASEDDPVSLGKGVAACWTNCTTKMFPLP